MQLEMKTQCEKCGNTLPADGQAYICSYEWTYCPVCAEHAQRVCPHCGGELILRPRREAPTEGLQARDVEIATLKSPLVWLLSFAVWALVALAASISIYEFDRSIGRMFYFVNVFGLELSQILTYAPLTPFVFALAIHFPLQRDNWRRRVPLYLAVGVLFSLAHITLRGLTPFGMWDPAAQKWISAIWDPQLHIFRIRWDIFRTMFYLNIVDDLSGTYTPIVIVAHAVSYYKRFRERDLRTLQLEGQLAKAHLQSLKSQIQPHFLFNTLHSISALMLTDVQAADKMMTRLSDLLRMSLENSGVQITTLSRELEFVTCYLVIESIRFDDRLSVALDIAPDTFDAQVPHLLLQPLVENAVRHGIARLSAPGEIRIISSHDGRTLHLTVRDNGPGFDALGARQAGTGLGLKATKERLQTMYGSDQSFNIRSAPGGGVEVSVNIPFRVKAGAPAFEIPA
jgi:two-component system LytT family sensor kinase